jgi:hypothetical protein
LFKVIPDGRRPIRDRRKVMIGTCLRSRLSGFACGRDDDVGTGRARADSPHITVKRDFAVHSRSTGQNNVLRFAWDSAPARR